MGVFHAVELAGVEMGAHKFSGAFQILSREDQKVEKTQCKLSKSALSYRALPGRLGAPFLSGKTRVSKRLLKRTS